MTMWFCLTNFTSSFWQLLEVLQQLWLLLSQLWHGLLPLLFGLRSHVTFEESLEKFAVFKQGWLNGKQSKVVKKFVQTASRDAFSFLQKILKNLFITALLLIYTAWYFYSLAIYFQLAN